MESRPGWRRAGAIAEYLTTGALIGALFLVPALGVKNARLVDQLTTATSLALESVSLRRSIDISPIEGTTLPHSLTDRMQDALRANISVESDDLLVVAFMPSVCGLCLTQGLESVNERLQSKHPNVLLHALVGEQGMRDREDVLRYRRTGLLDLPVTFIPAEELRTALFQHMGDRFPREPLYLRVDQDLRIRTAFQGNQVKPELLDRWLEANWPN